MEGFKAFLVTQGDQIKAAIRNGEDDEQIAQMCAEFNEDYKAYCHLHHLMHGKDPREYHEAAAALSMPRV